MLQQWQVANGADQAPLSPPPAHTSPSQLQALNRRMADSHAAQLKQLVPLADAKTAVQEAKQQGRRRAEEAARKADTRAQGLEASLAQQRERVEQLEAREQQLRQEVEGLKVRAAGWCKRHTWVMLCGASQCGTSQCCGSRCGGSLGCISGGPGPGCCWKG